MSEIPLNKFEKEERVIALHVGGKTIRDISKNVHMSFSAISKIIKAYDKKVRLQRSKEENNQQNTTQKKSLSSRAFVLFRKGKKPSEVKVLLNISFKQAKRFWAQWLNLERMGECYDLYTEFRYEIPNLLAIGTFMKRNNVPGNNIANVLRTANDITSLNKTYYNLKNEIKTLEQKRMYLMNYSPSPYSLQPLPLNKPIYHY